MAYTTPSSFLLSMNFHKVQNILCFPAYSWGNTASLTLQHVRSYLLPSPTSCPRPRQVRQSQHISQLAPDCKPLSSSQDSPPGQSGSLRRSIALKTDSFPNKNPSKSWGTGCEEKQNRSDLSHFLDSLGPSSQSCNSVKEHWTQDTALASRKGFESPANCLLLLPLGDSQAVILPKPQLSGAMQLSKTRFRSITRWKPVWKVYFSYCPEVLYLLASNCRS